MASICLSSDAHQGIYVRLVCASSSGGIGTLTVLGEGKYVYRARSGRGRISLRT